MKWTPYKKLALVLLLITIVVTTIIIINEFTGFLN